MTQFKPAASIRTHLFVAASIWGVVGLWLLSRGIGWLREAESLVWLPLSLFAGTAKSLLLLDRVAGKNVGRILRFDHAFCLGGVYSFKTWGLVLGMIVLGRVLRGAGLPLTAVGFLYATIGWALFFSSRRIWKEWKGAGRTDASET